MPPKSIMDLGNDECASNWMSKLHGYQYRFSSFKRPQLTPANSMAQSSKPKFLTMRMRTQNLALKIIVVRTDTITVVASSPVD